MQPCSFSNAVSRGVAGFKTTDGRKLRYFDATYRSSFCIRLACVRMLFQKACYSVFYSSCDYRNNNWNAKNHRLITLKPMPFIDRRWQKEWKVKAWELGSGHIKFCSQFRFRKATKVYEQNKFRPSWFFKYFGVSVTMVKTHERGLGGLGWVGTKWRIAARRCVIPPKELRWKTGSMESCTGFGL